VLTVNAAGLRHKAADLKNKIKFFNSAIFTVQETHFAKKGKFQMENFVIFEAIRKSKKKGGSMLGVHMDLNPVLVKEYSETFELIVVETTIGNTHIRIITGYGPQENWDEKDRLPFFEALECEVASAELEGRSVIISMDANSKLGDEYIPGDPHKQSVNGRLLANIMDRHALIVLNGLQEKRVGLITRERHTLTGIEKSVIDFVIMSSDLIKHVESIHIDEEREHVLTKIIKTKKHVKKTESDHNTIQTKINLPWQQKEALQVEIFNFKDTNSLKTFFKLTNETTQLTDIFKNDKPIEVQTKKFIKRINGFIHQSFKKIKITSKPDRKLEGLYDKRRYLRSRSDARSKEELEQVESELAEQYSETMYKKINQEIRTISGEDGGYNPGHLWQLKKKLSPSHMEPPTAMKDSKGKLLTTDEEIKAEAVKHYQKVFEAKPINEDMKDHKLKREKLCEERLKEAANNKSPPWTTKDVKNAIKDLNKGTSKDPHGHPNELFKSDVAGEDLVTAVTMFMNRLKANPQDYPMSMELCNVTSIYKNKGDRSSFDSHRGIFRTMVLRNILDRLIYNDEYRTVDDNLTDCNVGSRKKRNIRDNLFVMNAIMNSSKKGTDSPCDICVYDVRKCFDSLWLEECINDLYEAGLTNDKLCILYYQNKTARIAIRTPNGTTDRFTINNIVMQGTVWAGLMCTCTMDKLGKQAYNDEQLLYKYKGAVEVPPLQMVDDIIAATKCGNQTVATNSAINTFTQLKKLQLSEAKCARLHVSKSKCDKCPEIEVNGSSIKETEKEKYLGDYLTKYATPQATIQDRKQKGYGILSEIKAILEDIPLGSRRLEIGLTLREAWFINGTLFNSEVWCNYSKTTLKDLIILDKKILRVILGAHSKAPAEILYLETGALPIEHVITVGRLSYLKTILSRDEDEITKKVYRAQMNDPTPGDWVNQVKTDLQELELNVSEGDIAKMSDAQFKTLLKEKVRKKALNELTKTQSNHKKVKHIKYEALQKPQEYLRSSKFNNAQCSLLFNLRSQSVKGIRGNFSRLYKGEIQCPFECPQAKDTQEHIIICGPIIAKLNRRQKLKLENTKYSDLFGSVEEQYKITTLYKTLLQIRQRLLDQRQEPACQGNNTGPSL
jgi:exonuclease III